MSKDEEWLSDTVFGGRPWTKRVFGDRPWTKRLYHETDANSYVWVAQDIDRVDLCGQIYNRLDPSSVKARWIRVLGDQADVEDPPDET